MANTPARETVCFTHYETKEIRKVVKPNKLQQFSRDFIAAFMTSEEHYMELPWYREMVKAVLAQVAEKYPSLSGADLQIKAFPKVRIEFVKKFFPEYAPKNKTPKAKKPAKLDMWDL